MEKLLLLVALSVTFFVSCEEKEITSLEGTTWKYRDKYDGGWSDYKLTFTSTHAIYIKANGANNNSGFTGTYTFDPPVIEIVSDHWTFWGNPPEGTFDTPYELHHRGKVNGKTMKIDIWGWGDVIWELELKRQ